MSLIDYFKARKKTTASVAKERLQIIVSHERTQRSGPDYLPDLQRELVAVIRKYIPINDDMVQVSLDKTDDHSVLELNITLPEAS